MFILEKTNLVHFVKVSMFTYSHELFPATPVTCESEMA